MSFGWSAGDIVSAMKLMTEIVNALDEAQGAADEFRSTTYFLTSLTRTVAVFSGLETDQLPDALKTELSGQLHHIKIHVEAFLSEISQYQKLINPFSPQKKLSNVRSKLFWHFKVAERARKLQNSICKNLQIVEIMLQRAILTMLSTSRAPTSADLRKVIFELLPNKIEQDKDESLNSGTKDLISLDRREVPLAEVDKSASRSQTESATCITPVVQADFIMKSEIPSGASDYNEVQNAAFLFVVWLLICNTLQAALSDQYTSFASESADRKSDQSIYLLDAIGRHYELPYSYFQHLEVFLGFLQATFKGKSGSTWVNTGRYQLFGARYKVASVVTPDNWSYTICPGVKLFMSMVVEHNQHSAFDLECPLEACEGRLISKLGSTEGWTKCSDCKKEVFIVPPLASEDVKHTSTTMVPALASALQTNKSPTSSPQNTGHAIRTMYLTDHTVQDSAVDLDYSQMASFVRITKRLNAENSGCRPSIAFFSQANNLHSLWHRTLLETRAMFGQMKVIRLEIRDTDDIKELRAAICDMHSENHDLELLQLLTEQNIEELYLSLYNVQILIRLVNKMCSTERVGNMILSACLAIIDYGRQESIPLRDLLNLIAEINNILSNLQSNRLCSSTYLRNVFNAHFDYCLLTVNAIRSGGDWRSCPRAGIAKAALEAHVRNENFEIEVLKEERLAVLQRLKAGQEKLRRRFLDL